MFAFLFFLVAIFAIPYVNTSDQPKFDRSHETVSVVVGKRALLPCYVSIPDNNKHGNSPFKVIWMKLNNSSILTMEDRAINGDPRISLLHPYAAEWNLQIDDVDEDDAGIYRCVINTGMYKTLLLDVKVPPRIIDEQTTEPYPPPIRSGANWTIRCDAHGKPTPKIRILSYDQADTPKIISDQNEVTLSNVSRFTPRRYECIASNGYPPDVARSFELTIHYPPEISLYFLSQSNEELTAPLLFLDAHQHRIHLKCRIFMHPIERIIWLKDSVKLTNNHRLHQYVSTHRGNDLIAELIIKEFSADDQGEYTCMASNLLGTDSQSMQLLLSPTTTTTSTTTTSTSSTTTRAWRTIPRRRKGSKRTRITTATATSAPDELYPSTEVLREMTISSRAIHPKYQMMTLFSSLLFMSAYF